MIEKMKRSSKTKHGYKVWFRKATLKNTIEILQQMLEYTEEVEYVVDVQYSKPSVLIYTDDDSCAELFDKLIQGE